MKKIICGFCSLAIIVMCLSGCGGSSGNPFTDDDAIKGQIGDLCYVVPSNAVSDNAVSDSGSNNDRVSYHVPIEGSVEEYTLKISYTYFSQEDAKEVLEEFESAIKFIEEAESESGTKYISEDIYEFAGVTVDKGKKLIKEENGEKVILIMIVKSQKTYSVGYAVKTGFFDQSVWDNFYNQLKITESNNTVEE